MEVLVNILNAVWSFLNSAVGIMLVVGATGWLLKKLYDKKPDWKKYEGAIIEAVKYAEREIPDETPNKSMGRLNAALQYVLKIHGEVNGQKATEAEVAEIKEGIRIVHAELEANGNLKKTITTVAVLLLCCGLLFSSLGCQVIFQTPESGPATVGSPNNSAVTTEGQETDSNQSPVPAAKEVKNDVGN